MSTIAADHVRVLLDRMLWYGLLLANIASAVLVGYCVQSAGEILLLGIMLVGWSSARGEKP